MAISDNKLSCENDATEHFAARLNRYQQRVNTLLENNLRRGRPTVHIQFDEATAVLVGDAFNTMAFEILADPPGTLITAKLRCQLIRRLAVAAGASGMVGGQG